MNFKKIKEFFVEKNFFPIEKEDYVIMFFQISLIILLTRQINVFLSNILFIFFFLVLLYVIKKNFKKIKALFLEKEDFLLASFLFLCVFSLTRQFNFLFLSNLILVFFFCFSLFSLRIIFVNFMKSEKVIKKILFMNYFYLFALALYSLFVQQNSPYLVLRFGVILGLIHLCYFYPRRKYIVDIFLFLMIIHAIYLIGFHIYLNFNPTAWIERRVAYIYYGLGDVYTFNGWFFRIQILGNPLLPFAWFVTLIYPLQKKLKAIMLVLLTVGIIIAGNLTFWIVCALFLVAFLLLKYGGVYWKHVQNYGEKVKENPKKLILPLSILGIVLITLTPFAYNYVMTTLSKKGEMSMPVRFDQLYVLISNWTETWVTTLIGQGLGNTIDVVTQWRDYTGNFYFEMQSVYILNQVGIFYMTIFILTNLIFSLHFWKNKMIFLVYGMYLFYSSTNPYLFDMNHLLVIVILNSMSAILNEKKGDLNGTLTNLWNRDSL